MNYKITPQSPLKHLLSIRISLTAEPNETILFQLPIWRPGRYEAANYGKNIQKIKFYDTEGELTFQKPSHSKWSVQARSKDVFVEYTYYAHQMDAGNSFYDSNQLYINFINCMLYVENRMNEACEVEIDIPENYVIACGLKQKSAKLTAIDYFQLADSPLIASNQLEVLTYETQNVPFKIWIQGTHQLDTEKLKIQFKRFSEYQLKMMGEFPERDYHFLNQFTPYKHYHGVEHGNSTVICIGPGNELHKDELYSELLGVSSHELFHAWNILKIRPKEMTPYNFAEPPVFPTGFVAEGFTTYYGDLILVNSGVFGSEWYFKELNKLFNRHFHNGGRLNNSVVDSSLDLWIDGYQSSAPHKKSSIYVEGAMVALSLDLMIRQKSTNAKSLDDVMRLLWKQHGKTGIGYAYEDILHLCESVYGDDLSDFFENHVAGTHDKTELIGQLLRWVGCEMVQEDNPSFMEREFGVKWITQDGKYVIAALAMDGLGEQFFSVKDTVTKINGHSINDNLLKSLTAGSIAFELERAGEKLEVVAKTNERSHYKNYKITKTKNPSVLQKDSFKSWLNQEF